MWRLTLLISIITLLCGCATGRPAAPSVASMVSMTDDLADVLKALGASDRRRTLLVLDIDDTLLTSSTFFGSDAWYEWQRALPPDARERVPCRFDVIAMNYESGTQQPTQGDAAAIINSIPNDKIILTARSDLYRGATIRELRGAGYDLPAPLGQSDGIAYAWRKDSASEPVPVAYRDGVFMVSGQDKGVLLLDLLQRLGTAYDRIVLVDDGKKNIIAMRDALAAANISYQGIRYTRIDKTVGPRQVQAGVEGWTAWQQLLASTYPERLRRLQQNQCAY